MLPPSLSSGSFFILSTRQLVQGESEMVEIDIYNSHDWQQDADR